MGLWTFCLHRVVDLFVPGAGIVMDAADAFEVIQVCVLDFSV
jgi:hypothetical protein